MLTGSRPVNGSSSTSSRGLATTAAMNWTFCAMPFESVSTLSLAQRARSKRSSQPSISRAGPAHAFESGEEPQQLADPHLAVQAAFLGQVADWSLAALPRLHPSTVTARCRDRGSAGSCGASSFCPNRWAQ